MSRTLTVATRRGELALTQTQTVIAALKQQHPDLEVEIKEVTSEGDRDRRTVLWNLKDTGFFTSRLEEMLAAKQADFAVHSYKDLPTRAHEGLTVAAVFNRKFPEDTLLAREPIDSLDRLGEGARIGTSSLRRIAQLKHVRPDLESVPIRGNVRTRIEKLRSEDLDAVILARAGLERLGLDGEISFVFDPVEFIPAPAQGALAIQARAEDTEACAMLAAIDDERARAVTDAERQILTETKCGCHAPVGAYAFCDGDTMSLRAFLADASGRRLFRAEATGPWTQARGLGCQVALELLEAGGQDVLDELERQRNGGGIDA
ncbi:MAG: hydroxymethylbilane synthase [Phycisphaerales bacterium]|nr:MAG: hydroxymethylbilane synthase [Phycisphaerales bacterium]